MSNKVVPAVLYTEPDAYRKAFRSRVRQLARTRKTPFTSEDVTNKVGYPPNHPNAIGALMGRSATDLGLVRVGEVAATRPNQKGARISAYLGG